MWNFTNLQQWTIYIQQTALPLRSRSVSLRIFSYKCRLSTDLNKDVTWLEPETGAERERNVLSGTLERIVYNITDRAIHYKNSISFCDNTGPIREEEQFITGFLLQHLKELSSTASTYYIDNFGTILSQLIYLIASSQISAMLLFGVSHAEHFSKTIPKFLKDNFTTILIPCKESYWNNCTPAVRATGVIRKRSPRKVDTILANICRKDLAFHVSVKGRL